MEMKKGKLIRNLAAEFDRLLQATLVREIDEKARSRERINPKSIFHSRTNWWHANDARDACNNLL